MDCYPGGVQLLAHEERFHCVACIDDAVFCTQGPLLSHAMLSPQTYDFCPMRWHWLPFIITWLATVLPVELPVLRKFTEDSAAHMYRTLKNRAM